METTAENSIQPSQEDKKFNPLITFAVIAVIAIAVFALKPTQTAQESLKSSKTTASVDANSLSITSPESVAAETTNQKVITIDAGSFYYSIKEINVKKGDKVKIVLTGKDMMHDFNIDELNVKSDKVKLGESTTIEFTADKVGTFEYYCSIGQHRKNGQVGKITIE